MTMATPESRQLTLIKKGHYHLFRYQPGDEAALIQTLPRKVWEVKLQVTPEDRTTGPFRSRMLWSEGSFAPTPLLPGTNLPVRFRRAPRPLVMPDST